MDVPLKRLSSVTSSRGYGELQRDAVACQRGERLGKAGVSWVEQCLSEDLVTVAVSDNMTAYPMLIAPYVTGEYIAPASETKPHSRLLIYRMLIE